MIQITEFLVRETMLPVILDELQPDGIRDQVAVSDHGFSQE
jgi:hypothetical protein